MRAFITALLLFAILIGAVIANAIYIQVTCDKISDAAKSLKSAKQREPLLYEIKALWDKNHLPLNFSIRANEVERMNDLIESLIASHLAQNEAEFQKYCNLISELADEFSNYEKISFRSIC